MITSIKAEINKLDNYRKEHQHFNVILKKQNIILKSKQRLNKKFHAVFQLLKIGHTYIKRLSYRETFYMIQFPINLGN